MHSLIRSRHTAALLALLPLAALTPSASATTFFWGGVTGNTSTNTNWFTTAGGGTNPLTAPNSIDDDLVFNITGQNGAASTATVDVNLSAKSLSFDTTAATILTQNSNARTLNLGTGGITVNGAGAVSIGTNAHTPSLAVQLTDDQTWTNKSTGLLTIRNLKTASGAGAVTLTLSAASTGGITFAQAITETASNPLAIEINSAGTGTVTMASSSYSGGTTIKQGNLLFSSATNPTGTLGTSAIQLGDTAGNTSATFTVRSLGFTNNIIVNSGSSGTKTIITNQNGGAVLNGTLTLNDNLALTSTTDGTLTGVISGSGDLVKGGAAALTLSGTNTFSGDLTINTGAFTLAETTGSLTFYIGANGDTNQVNGTTTGAVAFNGTFNLNLTGAALADGNSWTLVSLASTAETYGDGFSITDFTQAGDIWTNGGFSYNELTGVLSYSAVPEPSTYALLGGFTTLLFAVGRRRTRA